MFRPSLNNDRYKDTKSDFFALKIIKIDNNKHSEATKFKINVLETLGRLDPDGKL